MSKMDGLIEHDEDFVNEDETLLLMFLMSLFMSIVVPSVLMVSPRLVDEGPLLASIILLVLAGPILEISFDDFRYMTGNFICQVYHSCNFDNWIV